jgi:hypothetical protein
VTLIVDWDGLPYCCDVYWFFHRWRDVTCLGWLRVCYDMDKHLSLPWLSAGDWLLPGRGTGCESYPSLRPKFGGHSLGLCFGVSLRKIVFKLVGRPLGKTATPIPCGAMQTLGYVKELRLVWFGNFKTQFGTCILAYRFACLASLLWYIADPMRDWETGNGCLLPII